MSDKRAAAFAHLGERPRGVVADLGFFCIELSTDFVVWMRRTNVRFTSVAECDTAHRELVGRLQALCRRALCLLVDLRQGPARNDPEFEAVVERHRKQVFEGFRRRAVLVRTPTGKMQLTRHLRQDGNQIPIFDDEHAALAYLHLPGED